MQKVQITMLLELLKLGRNHTLAIADAVPNTHYFRQLAEGKATPLWLLGHLARSADRILLVWTLDQKSIVGDELGMRFAPAHIGGIAPSTVPEDYPPWDGVKALYLQVMRATTAGLAELSDADLEKPLPGDLPPDYRERFPNIGAALKMVIAHDAYHRGQISLLSKLN